MIYIGIVGELYFSYIKQETITKRAFNVCIGPVIPLYAIHSLSTDGPFRLLVAYFVCCDRYVPDGVCQSASYIFLDGYVSNDSFFHRCLMVFRQTVTIHLAVRSS